MRRSCTPCDCAPRVFSGRYLAIPRVARVDQVHPESGLGAAVMPVFARMWAGYARQALEQLERLLV